MDGIEKFTTPELKEALEALEEWAQYESDMGDMTLGRINQIISELKRRGEYNEG